MNKSKISSKPLLRLGRILFLTILIGSFLCMSACHQILQGMLDPKGPITYEEKRLLIDSFNLMLIVVIPVFIMSTAFVIRYRAGHKTSEYKPNWGHSVLWEVICWGVPCAIIIVLGSLTWISSHKLDPYRRMNLPGEPMVIQAVALPWKWLFIYPKQNIATVNYLEIARGQQIEFLLTTDNVPMSDFFIPQLGSQIYTMAGMQTKLHLVSDVTGTFNGLNAQFNGDGFSDMRFTVKVVEDNELQEWIKQVKQGQHSLDNAAYENLIQPTLVNSVQYFSGVTPDLFRQIIAKYNQVENVPKQWNYHPSPV